MITLHGFIPVPGLPDMSPFCTKVETYFRMTGREYTKVTGDPRRAKKGKLPVVVDGDVRIEDSSAIVSHYEAMAREALDARRSRHERAVARAFQSMCEEHLVWVIIYFRWQDVGGFEAFKPAMHELLSKYRVPGLLQPVLLRGLRKQWTTRLHGQGLGRHDRDEIVELANYLLDAIAEWIGEGPFAFGADPSTLDATLYAFLLVLANMPAETPIQQHLRALPALRHYVDRIRATYFEPRPS